MQGQSSVISRMDGFLLSSISIRVTSPPPPTHTHQLSYLIQWLPCLGWATLSSWQLVVSSRIPLQQDDSSDCMSLDTLGFLSMSRLKILLLHQVFHPSWISTTRPSIFLDVSPTSLSWLRKWHATQYLYYILNLKAPLSFAEKSRYKGPSRTRKNRLPTGNLGTVTLNAVLRTLSYGMVDLREAACIHEDPIPDDWNWNKGNSLKYVMESWTE